MAFASFILSNVFRNRRRTFSAIIGITLAVTLISAEIIAIDTSAAAVVQKKLDEVPFDFFGFSSREVNNTTRALEKVRYITHVEPVMKKDTYDIYVGNMSHEDYGYRESYSPKYFSVSLVGVRQSFGDVMGKFDLSGSFDVSGATISDSVADALGLAVGDTLKITRREYNYDPYHYTPAYTNYTVNVTVTAVFNAASEPKDDVYPLYGGYYDGYGNNYFGYNTIFVNISSVEALYSALNYSEEAHGYYGAYGAKYSYYIWIERETMINAHDITATRVALDKERNRLSKDGKAADYTFDVRESELLSALAGIEQWLTNAKLIYMGVSFPAIGLGVYLGLIGIDLGMNERRREMGVLGARGCKHHQMTGMFIAESLIAGLIAGILGIFFGALTSKLVISVGASPGGSTGDMLKNALASLTIEPVSIALSIAFAVGLMMLAMLGPARRMLKTAPIDNLKLFSTTEAQMKYASKWDVVMIFVGISAYIGAEFYSLIRENAGLFGFMGAEACLIFAAISLLLMPVSPFLLIFGITRILTRATRKLYDISSTITKPVTGEMWHLVNRNIVRNPKRISSVCTIVSLALAFGLFVAMTSDSQIEYQRNSIAASVGSDIFIETGENINFTDKLYNIDGVDVASPYMLKSSTTNSMYGYLNYILLNSTAYSETVELRPSLFRFGDASSFQKMANDKVCVVDNEFADRNGVDVGDFIEINFDMIDEFGYYHSITMQYKIAAIVGFLPGLGDVMEYAVVDFKQIPEEYDMYQYTGVNYHIKTKSGYDPDVVAKDIKSVFPSEVIRFRTVKTETERLNNDPIWSSMPQFLNLEFGFTVLIVTIGLGLIMFVASLEREREMAGIVARGASTAHIESLFLGEGLTIITMGTIIGTTTGLATAYVYSQVFKPIMGAYGIDYYPVFTINLAIVVLVTIISMIAAVFFVARRARALDLTEALRLRGG